MKAILAYNYNQQQIKPKSNEMSIGGPTSAFTPYSDKTHEMKYSVDTPERNFSPLICESKFRRKDAFRKIKIMFGLT